MESSQLHNDSPFNPGFGTMPAVFAGRAYEKKVLKQLAQKLYDKRPVGQLLSLIGPSGTGKTCLQSWFTEGLAEAGIGYWSLIQLLGKAIHEQIRQIDNDIDVAFQQACDAFESRKERFYTNRYNELHERNIVESAAIVARLLVVHGACSRKDIVNAIQTSTPNIDIETCQQQFRELTDKGFIWDVKPNAYEPGIPSLMSYVLDQEQILT